MKSLIINFLAMIWHVILWIWKILVSIIFGGVILGVLGNAVYTYITMGSITFVDPPILKIMLSLHFYIYIILFIMAIISILVLCSYFAYRQKLKENKDPAIQHMSIKDKFNLNIQNSVYHTQQLTTYSSSDSVFHFNEPLTNSDEFYGRDIERNTLLQRARRSASTSIIGSRKIGKTWLLQYLQLIAQTDLGPSFRLAYLDATAPSCKTVTGFIYTAVDELSFSHQTHDMTELERVVKELNARKYTPILCIDEFEGLSNKQEFSLEFFRGLRAITQKYNFVLITVSKKPLFEIIDKEMETSGFFNIFEQIKLEPFGLEETKTFIDTKSTLASFTRQESERLWKYGQENHQQWSPLRLQLAGNMLWEEKSRLSYRPKEVEYWQMFEQRLEEKYKGVVQ